MKTRSAFSCKTPGCRTVLGYVANGWRLKLTAGEMAGSNLGLIVVCPSCGARRQWLEIPDRRSA